MCRASPPDVGPEQTRSVGLGPMDPQRAAFTGHKAALVPSLSLGLPTLPAALGFNRRQLLAIVRCPEEKVILPFQHWKLISCQRALAQARLWDPKCLLLFIKLLLDAPVSPGTLGFLRAGLRGLLPSAPSISCC